MGPGEEVDSGGSIHPLQSVTGETYSTIIIPQARIVEPIHPLLNKKMLAQPGGKIILFTRRSGSRLRLAALNEMGLSRG